MQTTTKTTLPFENANMGSDDFIGWLASRPETLGPVFRMPAPRPTYVFRGRDALEVLDDPTLVERTRSVFPLHATIFKAFFDENVAVLFATSGTEHKRRRASWLDFGGLDRAGIANILPMLASIIDSAMIQWEKKQVFALNSEVMRVVSQISCRLVCGCEGDDQTLADLQTLTGLDERGDFGAAKARIIQWITGERTKLESNTSTNDTCIASRFAKNGQLSADEWMNEIKHGLLSTLGLWIPIAELVRQFAADHTLASTLRSEIAALDGNGSPLSGLGKTPQLTRQINDSLRRTSLVPVIFARAKTSFSFAGVNIPANAVLISALHATNQLPESQKDAGVSFGVGQHRCPAADANIIIPWLFAAKLLASYDVHVLDKSDVPVQQSAGYYAPRGCFVRFARLGATPLARGNKLQPQPFTTTIATGSARNTRIAIVGGGITGLTLAHELRKTGYQNVTVFERAPSVGGKADTVTIEGRPYNLGAHLCNGDLGVAALAKDVGVRLERAPFYQYWDIDRNQPIPRSYNHYGQVENLRRLLAALPDLANASGFAAVESWTYASISSWLEANGLSDLHEIGPFFTGAGYGFFNEDLPVAAFLKFAQHMNEDAWTPTGGYKHLLERVSEGLDVRCDTEVVHVQRGERIRMATRRTSAVVRDDKQAIPAEGVHDEEFDRLILACPLEQTGVFLDQSDEEKALFSRICVYNYYTVLATLEIQTPHASGLYIVPKNTSKSSDKGHTTAFVRVFEDTNVYHFFCYGQTGQSDTEILENVREDARKLGGEIKQVHVFQKWAYAPHVSPHDMALGFHGRLDRLQGRLGTYYAGSLLAFELTDHNVLQAKSLVERFFAGQPQTGDLNDNVAAAGTVADTNKSLSPTRLPEQGTQSILEILGDRYEQTPNATFSTFLNTNGKTERAFTYKTLVERAMACAVNLQDKGVKPGDRVALVYPPDTDEFLVGFFGCLCAEAIAVPVACPDPRRLDIEIPRFAHLMQDCDCRVALTTRMYHAIAFAGRAWSNLTNLTSDRKIKWPKLVWISTDGLSPLAPTARHPIPTPAADTLAYLQYTSGSTSDPKGVMINHGNVLHNVEAIRVQTEVNGESVLVGWVPLFHDMGLVGGPLLALYCGAHVVFFSPLSFLQNPLLWVKAMHQFRATHTESPNFGYEFLLRHVDDDALRGIDLSCLRYTLFGGEVMRPRTFERMAERLHGTGFRAESMTNIYGAAEATLFLAGGGIDNPPLLSVDTRTLESKRRAVPKSPNSRSTSTLIGCGIPPAHGDVRIVDPSNQRLLPDREVGEIWFSSPSVSKGYWGRSGEQNDAFFSARVANDPKPLRTYLRTGDLGFIDRGVLYICGRHKEMMIFGGRNIYPIDIEQCAMHAHDAIRQGCVVAFSVEENEQEKLVIVAEIKSRADASAASAAATAITRVLLEQHNLTCKAILLVRSGTLPKTSSGKLQRYRAREEYLNDRLSLLGAQFSDQETMSKQHTSYADETPDLLRNEVFTGDVTATRHWLQRLVAMVLHANPDDVSTSESLAIFGIDSAQALKMTLRISSHIGRRILPAMLYEHPTIDSLALDLCSHTGTKRRVLVQLQQGEPDKHPRLFCVHPAGGSAMAYLALVAALPNHYPVYAFGNDEAEAPTDDLGAMAKYYVSEMQAVQPSGPYYLLGYSFGGTVAYEMARQILEAGNEIGSVFMIDAFAPLYQDHTPGPQIAESESYFSFLETAMLNQLIPNYLDDEEREKLRLRVEQNQRAFGRYRIEPRNNPAGNQMAQPRIKMFRASEEAPHLRDSARHPAFDRPDFGWGEVAPGSVVKIEKVPGDHFSVMNEPTLLAAILVDWLNEAGLLPG